MRIGFVGPSYSVQSNVVADEECINFFAETNESQGFQAPIRAYSGAAAETVRSYFGTPGYKSFCAFPESPTRGGIEANGRGFEVAGNQFYEIFADGTFISRGTVANDGNAASLAFNSIQILIVAGGHAYCFTLATNVLLEVT